MCGRYWIGPDDSSEQLKEIIAALNRRQAEKKSPQTVKTGEIFPTDTVPVVANSRSMKQTPFLMQWGFSGFGRGKKPIINARSETAMERPMFREPLLERRCLIPASHYFEWQTQGRTKIKHAIRTIEPMIFMAGIYRFEKDKPLPVFSILTRSAAPEIEHIHDRMPVILPGSLCDEWLNPNADVQGLIEAADSRVEYGAVM